MFYQDYVQAAGNTPVHRERESPGMPARGRQQNMRGLGRVVEADGFWGRFLK
jgi:hypothetical protein